MARVSGIGIGLLLLLMNALAQPNPDIRWTRMIGGDSTDYAYGIIQTSDGFLIVGETKSYGDGDWDVYVVKTDSLGYYQWQRTYGGPYIDHGYAIRATTDGMYVIAGSTQTYAGGPGNVYFVKINGNGVPQWERTFTSTHWEEAYDVQPTTDGGYILAGRSDANGQPDVYLIKMTSTGSVQWSQIVRGNRSSVGYSVLQTADGFMAAGIYLWPVVDGYLVKTTASGSPRWTRTYGGNGDDVLRVVRPATGGGYILAGSTESYSTWTQPYLVKTDDDGYVDWSEHYTVGGQDAEFFALERMSDGGYVAAGRRNDNFYLARIDSLGGLDWDHVYGGIDDEEARGVLVTRDRAYVLVGYTESYGARNGDIYLLKTGTDPSISAVDEFSPVAESFSLHVYPNPFNASATVMFSLPRPGPVDVRVFDVTGRLQQILKSGRGESGETRVEFNGSGLVSGVYLVRLMSGQQSSIVKLMLMK